MARKFNAGYYFSEGFHSIFTHGFMSFAAVCMIVACLLIMGSFSLLAVNLNHMLGDLETENEFLAYVDESYSEEEARALQSQIEAVPNVSQVTFVSKEEALEEFLEGREHNDLLDSMPATVLRDRYRIHVDDIEQMEQTTKLVEQVPGVAKVNAAIAIAQGFVLVRNIATGVALVLVGILAGGLPVHHRQHHQAGHLLPPGGDRHHEDVRRHRRVYPWPFVVEGMILGLAGAFIAFFAQWGLYQMVGKVVIQGNGLSLFTMLSYGSMAKNILGVFCGTGALIGVGGSLLAIRKFLQV